MKLSILIPVYNERDHVEPLLEKVTAVDLSELGLERELLIVDDGSTDGTREILDKWSDPPAVRVVHHDRNRGKGAAVRTALAEATGDVFLVQDADLEYDPRDYLALIRPVLEGEAEVVYGSRVAGAKAFGTTRHSSILFYLGGLFLTRLTNLLYGSRLTDEPTGYKLFSRRALEAIPPLVSDGFQFCPELTARFLKAGLEIHERPIRYYPRKRREGKKIRGRDGWDAVVTLFKYRFRD